MWYDLGKSSDAEGGLLDSEVSEEGFRKVLRALNWLWNLPKNARTFGTRWKQCERLSRGEPHWYWIRKIAALKSSKIVWEERLDQTDSEVFVVSADGTDFRTREISSDEYNKDPKKASYKFKHCALRYEVAISVRTGRVVWIRGLFEEQKTRRRPTRVVWQKRFRRASFA